MLQDLIGLELQLRGLTGSQAMAFRSGFITPHTQWNHKLNIWAKLGDEYATWYIRGMLVQQQYIDAGVLIG